MPESNTGNQQQPFHALPPESRLGMPVQNLSKPANMEGRGRTPATSPSSIALRRFSVIGSALALTAYGAWRTHMVMDEAGVSALGIIMLVLFIALFMWIALAFTSSVAGFCSLVAHGGLGLGIRRSGPLPQLTRKTALLLPTYNEPPHRVMAGLRTIYTSLEETGQLDRFDLFILSDTTNPDVWVQEEAAFLALREQVGGYERIFYWRRHKNVERKAGNVGEWVRRFGGASVSMGTLDAESNFSGQSLDSTVDGIALHSGPSLYPVPD